MLNTYSKIEQIFTPINMDLTSYFSCAWKITEVFLRDLNLNSQTKNPYLEQKIAPIRASVSQKIIKVFKSKQARDGGGFCGGRLNKKNEEELEFIFVFLFLKQASQQLSLNYSQALQTIIQILELKGKENKIDGAIGRKQYGINQEKLLRWLEQSILEKRKGSGRKVQFVEVECDEKSVYFG